MSTPENNSNTLNKRSDRIVFVSEQQDGSQETYSIGQKAKVTNKSKAVATKKPLREQQVSKRTAGKVFEKKHHKETCNHPQCYVS